MSAAWVYPPPPRPLVSHLPLLLTYAQAAEQLGVTTETVRQLVQASRLERVYVTERCPRIPQESLLAFRESLGGSR